MSIGLSLLPGRVGLPQQDVSAQTPAQAPSVADYAALKQRKLLFPVPGVDPAGVHDTFNETRGEGRRHEATDIEAPAGTPVLAVDDGTIKKLFYSVRGGVTIYQFDPTATYCYYYAHLQQYADGLRAGQTVRRGDLIAFVGSSGDAPASDPHLHFAISKLGPEAHWWEGTPIDPYPVIIDEQAEIPSHK